MPSKKKNSPRRDYRIRVRAVRRSNPDLHRLARALILLAEAEAEQGHKKSQASQSGSNPPSKPPAKKAKS